MDDAPEVRRPAGRSWRSLVAGIAGLLAVVGVLASSLAVWTRAVIFDSDKVAAAVSDTLSEPDVAQTLARYVTDQVFVAVDADGFVTAALPAPLTPLAPAIVGGARSFVADRVSTVIATDAVRELVRVLVRQAHQAFVRLVEGDGLVAGLTVSEGQVTVNLVPLVGRGLGVAQSVGLFRDLELPELRRDGDPVQQIAALEQATGRDLPDDFAQLVVYESAALADAEVSVATAQRVVTLFKRAVWVLLVVTVGLLVGAILLARDRRRAAIVLALGVAGSLLVGRALIGRVVDRLPEVVVDPGARAALTSALGDLVSGLIGLTTLLVVAGLVVATGAFLLGESTAAAAIRGRVGATSGSLRSTIDQHRDGASLVAFGAAVLLLVIAELSWWSLATGLVLTGAGAWTLWAPRPG